MPSTHSGRKAFSTAHSSTHTRANGDAKTGLGKSSRPGAHVFQRGGQHCQRRLDVRAEQVRLVVPARGVRRKQPLRRRPVPELSNCVSSGRKPPMTQPYTNCRPMPILPTRAAAMKGPRFHFSLVAKKHPLQQIHLEATRP